MVKAMTILTSRMANDKAKNVKKAAKAAYEPSFTEPAERNTNTAYVNLGGVMFAVK